MRKNFLKKSQNKAKNFFVKQENLGYNSSIYKSSKFILRSTRFTIDYKKIFKCLDTIDFIYDPINKHWAETDSISISINIYKTFTDELLTNTLIHEALHGVIIRNSGHTIPEEKEHNIMYLIDPNLI